MNALTMWPPSFRKVFLRGGSPYYYCRKYLEMARTPREWFARRRLASVLAAQASKEDRFLVQRLEEHGYVVVDGRLDLTDELVAECKRRVLAESILSASSSSSIDTSTKYFWKSLSFDDDLAGDSVFVRYALQERLVRCASLYLGQAPYLSTVDVQYSFAVTGAPTHSQRWHKDFDDTRMFKVVVYCSDVTDEDDGPFHVADRKALRGIYASPLYSSRRYDDEQFGSIADRTHIFPICGPAGTTFVCDTQQVFHYGSRCRRPRLACFFTYQTYAGLYPIHHRAGSSSRSPLAYVLSPKIAGGRASV